MSGIQRKKKVVIMNLRMKRFVLVPGIIVFIGLSLFLILESGKNYIKIFSETLEKFRGQTSLRRVISLTHVGNWDSPG